MSDEVEKIHRSGGCQCGAVRYQLAAEPVALYVCHCRECQKQSASAFGISVITPRDGFRLTRGTPKLWSRSTDSGNQLECAFCPDCGSRLWHRRVGGPDLIGVQGAAAGQPVDPPRGAHLWAAPKR